MTMERAKDLECPYCGEEQDSDECEPNVLHEKECCGCGKIFGYEIEYFPSYTETKLPCANGELHKWEKKRGWPEEYYLDLFRCVYCEKERTILEGEQLSLELNL